MADVNSNIGINFDTRAALASLRKLQAGLSTFNQSLTQGNVAAMNAQKGLNSQLIQAINATGKFVASQKEIATSTGSFTRALEKNQLSMREYFRYTAAAATANTKTFKGMFAQEREIINRARKDRVKLLQSQYIQLGNANGDLVKVLQVVPKHLQMANGKYADYATRVQMAAQRQQFLNQLLKQGSTNLLNFGKNTQWAGRQLMVGLTIPLSILGSAAAKTFMEMEEAVLKFTRVYGDITTSGDATNKAVANIQRLGKEFTKYGITVKDTMEMAATAAAMGMQGDALEAQVVQATRLSVLGQVEQQQALETTISLQNAFGVSSEQLAQKINFLNAVENQTVLSIEDLTIAIPKAGPVVKQLGGDVEDLAFFMTAMKEGGINASEGANALKSGLASMINPAKKTSEFLAGLGINIKGIVDNNAGNLKGTVVGLARALDTLDPLNRARAIEQLFGKFQFARMSTLFQNVAKDGTQASRALDLAGASIEELAILSERELARVENSTGAKFKKAMENLKNELVPVGKAFLQAITPIVEFVGKILAKFNGLSDGTKKVITIMIGVLGAIAPVALMTFGVLVNGIANVIKFFAMLRGGIAKLNGQNNVLGGGFDYLTNQQTELLAETNALHTSHQQLLSTFNVEKGAVDALALAYGNAASQARALAQSSPGLFNSVPGPAGAVAGLPPKKFADGGVVPGTGNKDTVPALLTPGEVVLTKQTAKENPELIAALQNGSVMKYAKGTGKTGTQTNPGRTGFSIAGETFGLAISPKSDKVVAQVEKLAAAMQDGTLGVENGADVLKEVFARLADDSRVTITEFVQELRIATKSMGGVELTPAQINTAAGATGPNDKLVGHSAGEAGVSKNVRDQMYAAGRGEEYERLQTIANNTGDRLASERPDLPRLQRPDKKNVQLDRGHIGAIGTTEKGVQEGWDPDLWDLSTHAENEMSQTLASNNDARRVYLEKLQQSSATEEEILSISQKVTSNGALNERELQIQKEVLGSMLADKDFMAAEQKKAGKGKAMSIEKTMLATVYDAEGRAAIPVPQVADLRSTEERLASGRAKVRGRFGKNNSPEVGSDAGFVPLSDAERAAKLDSLKISEDVDADLTDAEKKAETASPSRRTKRLGKDIADGLAQGLEEGTPGVKTKSSQLTDAALPSAAETQAKTDKMDLGNKAFYDDIDTPEMRDERQVLKSLDRQRRKRGATTTVDSVSSTPVTSQASLLTASKTSPAAAKLEASTEQAATAQAQVVQQIKDESSSRVKIKGNTINIGQARQEADRLDKEASEAEAAAAKVRTEAAKWEEVAAREGGKNMHTAENARDLKKLADEAEIRAAEARIKAAEADMQATQLENGTKASNEIISNGTQEQGDGLKRIVEGTDDTAGSTLLVADQTDELVTATGDAVNAQTTNADNLITTGQLTAAANNNLGEMLPAMDQTGVAQQDLATSSANIAVVNDDIEAEKREQLARLKEYNAKEAAAMAAENGIVPPGSQSGNEELGKNRMGSVEAYEEASTYTRDKNGQIIFDPELDADGKKQPTTLSAKQVKEKKRGMRRESVGKFSGKISGAAGTAAMVAGMAGAPPAVTAGLGAVATVAQFAPMLAGLTGPQGIVVALLALGAGAFLLNKKLQATAEAIAKFTRTTTVSTDMLKKIGEQTGKVGASELMNKKRSGGQLQTYNEANRDSTMEATQFLEGDAGKALQAAFVANSTKNGTEVAAEQFALQIAAAISDGTIAPELGQKIAYQMGINLKDSVAATRINVQLRKLIGPNGEDLGTDPLEIRARISQQASSLSEELVRKVNSDDRSEVGSNSIWSQIGTLGMIGAASGSDKTAALAVASSSAVETAQAQADAMSIYYDEQLKVLRAQRETTTDKAKQLELDTKIKDMLAEQETGMARMNNAVVAQIDRQTSYARDLIQSTTNTKSPFVTGFLNDDMRREDAFFDAQKSDVKAKFKGTAQEASAQRVLDIGSKMNARKEGFASKDEGQVFESKMNLMMQSGQLSPDQIEGMAKIFSGDLKKMDTVLTVGMRLHGGAKMGELASMLTGVNKKTAKTIMLRMSRKNPKEFEEVGNALALLQASDGLEVDMQAAIELLGEKGLAKLGKDLAAIEAIPDPITKTAITAFVEENPDMNLQGVIDNWEYYESLEPEVRKEAIQTYKTLFETATNFKTIAERDAWAKVQAENAALLAGDVGTKEYNEKYTTTFEALTMINGKPATLEQMNIVGDTFAQEGTEAKYRTKSKVTSNDGGKFKDGGKGDKKKPLAFLDDLAMRIKNVRDGAFDATKPLASMLAAFSNPKLKKDMDSAFKVFDGLQQRMIKMGVPKEFRDMIKGMSAEDFKDIANLKGKEAIFNFKKGKPKTKANIESLTDTGKKTMKFYNEAIVGEGNVANREAVEQVANQEKAFRILVSEGASATEALEHVQDAALAASIAAGALGKKGSAERKQYIADLKKATDETERFALRQKMIQANEEFKLLEQMPKLGTAMKMAGFSADQMQEVLNDPALAKSLIEDLKDGKVDSKEIADYLNSIEARKIIDIQVNYNSGNYSESARPGMEIVNEMFAVQEQMLRTGADPRTTAMVDAMDANNKAIREAEMSAKGYRDQIELINRSIADAEREIELNYTRPIEDMQEQISDKQRTLEMDPEFGDRAMEEINKANAIMSNDSTIMANQAEKINEEYDKQAEALEKVAQINEEITNQQKSQLDIAGALTSGDIAAAARAAQDARAQSAQRFGTATADALQQSRENEIKGLRGAQTGLSQEEIDDAQFANAQALYEMETDPRRTQILEDIRGLEDLIYAKQEEQELKARAIRDQQDLIYEIEKNKLQPLEDQIKRLTDQNELFQMRIDKEVENITVLDKTKLQWDRIQAQIDANALAGKNLDGVLGGLLASVGAIADKWQTILDKLKEYNSTPVAVKNAQTTVVNNAATAAAAVTAEKTAANAVTGATTDSAATAASKAAAATYAAAKAAGDSAGAALAAAKVIPSVLASGESGAIGAASIASQLKAAEKALAASNAIAAQANALASFRAKEAAENAAANAARSGGSGFFDRFKAKGGLIDPVKFAKGGFAKGTDTVPAMLTPGEFIMSKYAVDQYWVDTMRKINNGDSVGGAVYNNTYTLTVNAKTDANPNEIAQAVMSTIRNVEGRRVRGVSLND